MTEPHVDQPAGTELDGTQPENTLPDGTTPVGTTPESDGPDGGPIDIRGALEALLLVIDTPATVEQLAQAIEVPPGAVRADLSAWAAELAARGSGMELRESGEGWRLYTRTEFAPYVERLLLDGARSKLTRAAMETLAVVAYRQPVTRSRVSAVRGVNVDGVIRTLLARGLINEVGTDNDSGAVTYGTTELFLERLGLTTLADLPDLAPLLPDVDLIDDVDEELQGSRRLAKLGESREPETIDVGRSEQPALDTES